MTYLNVKIFNDNNEKLVIAGYLISELLQLLSFLQSINSIQFNFFKY